MPAHLTLSLVASIVLSSCYLSHRVEESADGGARDSEPDARDGGTDATSPDTGPPDAGPERPFEWIPLATDVEERPPGRLSHLAVYDERADRMIILGGYDPYGDLGTCCIEPYLLFSDVWSFDLGTERWTRLGEMPHPVLALNPVVAALDRLRNRIVIVGAVDAPNFGSVRNLALDLTTFEATRLPAGPWGRQWPLRATHDSAAQRIVVHDAYYEDTEEAVWSYDLRRDEWTTIESEGAPEVRFHSPLTHTGSGAVLYAGFEADSPPGALLWHLSESFRWTSRPLTGELERGRWSHRAVHEPVRNTLVVYGGMYNSTHLDTFVIDLEDAVGYAPIFDALGPTPEGRRDHSMVLDTTRRQALVFGGARGSEDALDDVWALRLP